MTIDISSELLDKLVHNIPEIRARAIANVLSKFECCCVDLQDLVVDANVLTKRLLKWFDYKPVSNVKQILEILHILLKSKYRGEVVRILSKYKKHGGFSRIETFVEDPISKRYLKEITQIISNNRVDFVNQPNSENSNSPKKIDDFSNSPKISDEFSGPYNVKDVNANSSCNPNGLRYEAAWEVLGQKELQSLSTLKASLSIKHDPNELEHALQYFQQYILDFPGEFFLQSPFIFTNLLQLIDCESKNFDHTLALTTCLKLTQNLARRVVVRRVPCMSFSSKEQTMKQQVTIGSYCFKTFQSVLNLLRNIYVDSNLASINECFLILIELVDLICKSADEYSHEVVAEYHIDQIIEELSDFLRFIRDTTCNFRRNGHKTNRNNSISILFLLCQLLIFKDNRHIAKENGNISTRFSPKANDSAIDLDISQKIRNFSLREGAEFLEKFNQMYSSSNTIDDTASMSTLSNYVTAIENTDSTWKRELDIALLDFPLQHFYHEVYELIVYALKIDALPDKCPVKLLMNLSELFEPVIGLLKDPKMFSYEMVLSHGLKSIDVLTIVKSEELIHLLFNAITNLTPQYTNNEQLQHDAEKMLLHLMSFKCTEMKRLIYKLTSEKMAFLVGCIMESKHSVPKSYGSAVNKSCLFGLPLTAEILAEVVCNGLLSEDAKIKSYAETIIIQILRIKSLLPQCWNEICKFMTPVLPLILCHAKSTTKIGSSVLQLVEPDNNNQWPTVVLIKSNVALLFTRDTHTQSEALYRLMYLLQSIPNAELYMPSLRCINDVIPAHVCIVEPLPYSNNDDFSDLYEIHLVQDLLNVLQNRNTEPSIRHSTLSQLNIVLEDPIALNRFYEIDGQSIILDALEKSLRENSTDNYAYNAIQIISILTKLCLRIPAFRRRLEDDIQSYVLILRSLMLFHTNDKFKRDCSILLFTLAFSGYIVGGNKQLIVPPVCKRLWLPIVCEFSWSSSADHHNLLDSILSHENTCTQYSDDMSSNQSITSRLSADEKNSQIWQYIRMSFSALWFGSLDHLIDSPNFLEGSKNTELNYKTNADSLSFNRALRLTAADLEIIEGTSQKYGLNYWVKFLRNATTSGQVALSCAAIENFSNVDAIGHRKQWDCVLFLKSIKRFCSVTPKSKQDELIFTKICRLLANLIDRDFIDVHKEILKEFQQNDCIYFDLLKDSNVTTPIFLCNVRFIEAVLTKTIDSELKSIQQHIVMTEIKGSSHRKTKMKSTRTVYEAIFETALERLDSLLCEKELDKIRGLVSLIRLVSSSGQVLHSEYNATYACNKLLKLVLAVSSLSYVGSRINKNCLLAIGNIMISVDELHLEKRYITFLSTLCGHIDFEVRAYSWSILLKIASTLDGAESLVQEMSCLPGGLFACCLNTLLDDTESAIVRENAALVFAALISYRKPNNELIEKLYPKGAHEIGVEWIGRLLEHHDLIGKIFASTNDLYVKDVVEPDKFMNNDRILPCNLMRSYCIILWNLLPLKGAGDVNDIFSTMLEISKLIPKIRYAVNNSSILLLAEICALVSKCVASKKSLLERIAREFHIIHALISFLNVDVLETIPKPTKHRCWPNILKLLRRLATAPAGFQIICDVFYQEPEYLENTVTLTLYGLSDKDINVPVMRFITNMMIISQASDYQFATFAQLLNDMHLSANVRESTKKFVFNVDFISQSIVDWLDGSETDSPNDEPYVTELLYKRLSELFEHFSNSSTNKQPPIVENQNKCFEFTCQTLETLLKCSNKARVLATEDSFVIAIVEQMENIYASVGGSLTDYVRKCGNLKVEKYVKKLKLLLHIMLCWYSADCLQDMDDINAFIPICQKFWISIGVDAELQMVYMKTLFFISNNSYPVCKAISTAAQFSVGGQAFLGSIIEYAIAETGKPKQPKADMDMLEMTLKIVTNCCSCVEGRSYLKKHRMLDTLSRLHPQVTRSQKPWPQITTFWLTLLEAFTRYKDGSKVIHLNLLCNLAESSVSRNRRLALEILRNMSFNSDNRAALLESPEFQRVIYSILDKNVLGDEQLLVTVSIWKLVANYSKGKNTIKNSPILGKLRALKETADRYSTDRIKTHSHSNGDTENQSDADDTPEELAVVLNIVLSILLK